MDDTLRLGVGSRCSRLWTKDIDEVDVFVVEVWEVVASDVEV